MVGLPAVCLERDDPQVRRAVGPALAQGLDVVDLAGVPHLESHFAAGCVAHVPALDLGGLAVEVSVLLLVVAGFCHVFIGQ